MCIFCQEKEGSALTSDLVYPPDHSLHFSDALELLGGLDAAVLTRAMMNSSSLAQDQSAAAMTLSEYPTSLGAVAASAASSTYQPATGNAFVDGLLSGSKWTGTITFSFPQVSQHYSSLYSSSEPWTDFSPISLQGREATRAIMGGFTATGATNVMTYGSVASLIATPVQQTSGNGLNGLGDIASGQSSRPSTAWAYYPSRGESGRGGDIWYGTAYDFTNPQLGNYYYYTYIHELGHALGLKHTHEGGGVANTAVPASRDAIEYTVMSYRGVVGGSTSGGTTFERWGAPQTFMANDILALQTMYGPNYSTYSGNTSYSWSPTTGQMFIDGVGQGIPGANRVFLTIWDGGGIDTYNMSNYLSGVLIDLVPGSGSITSTGQLASLRPSTGQLASATVYNALQFNGDAQSLIENAIGGSGNDTIGGNSVANVLLGLTGSDRLAGLGGHDTLHGGVGTDTAFMVGTRSQYNLRYNSDIVVVTDSVAGRDGTDSYMSVEFISFSDATIRVWTDPLGLALTNQLATVYLGRGVARELRDSISDNMGSQGITSATQAMFFEYAVRDGTFDSRESITSIVNKTFLNMFGVGALQFEQDAWADIVVRGIVSREALPWTLFASYLGADNVPASYQVPAQSRIIAVDAFSNALTGTSEASVGVIGSAGAATARSWLLPIRSQADAANKVTSAAQDVRQITTELPSRGLGAEAELAVKIVGDIRPLLEDLA